jgi:hypothetical protein
VIRESGVAGFFNDPIVHWHRDVFSHVPSTTVREIAVMLDTTCRSIPPRPHRDAAARQPDGTTETRAAHDISPETSRSPHPGVVPRHREFRRHSSRIKNDFFF